MNFLATLEFLSKFLPAIAAGVTTVLHFTGADRHRTIAGDLAPKLTAAAEAAAIVHAALLSASQDDAQSGGGS